MLTIGLSMLSANTFAQKTILKSDLDELLVIKNITIAPLVDNVSGIYAKPLSTQLASIVENDRQWSLNTFPENFKQTPEELEDQPQTVQNIAKKNLADAVLSGRIIKGPNGISIKLNLFLAKDGKLFARSELQNYSGFEIADLRKQMEFLFEDIKSKLPYSGKILSRKKNQVTVDVGTLQGLKEGDELNVVQILKLNRHPKYNFTVSTEKEIIGKLKITKADSSLSFADVILERYDDVIQPKMKVEIIKFIQHQPSTTGSDTPDLSQRKDTYVLGENPKEWVPTSNPTVGKLSLLVGLANYAVSNTLSSSGGVNSSQFPSPNVGFDAEIWMTSEWFLDFKLQQYILTLSNNLSGSGPGKLSVSSSQLGMFVGYNFLLSEQFFGPKFQILGGYSQLSSQVETSSPSAYTSVNMSGFGLGFAGSMPVDEKIPLSIGAKFLYYLTGTLQESPQTSGSSSSVKISQFSFFGSYKWTDRLNWRGELNYDLYSAGLSGSGTRTESASSISHTITNFLFGVEYLF